MHDYIKHYEKRVAWSDEDECFVARVTELPSITAFGDTEAEALSEIAVAADLAVKSLLEEGDHPVPEPLALQDYSGTFQVRVPTDTHSRLASEAKRRGISMNAHIKSLLELGARVR